MKLTILLLFLPTLVFASPCPHPVRHRAPLVAFVRTHPCPSTGKRSTHCPGYVIDHIKPLCACGKDVPENMQWQTIVAAKAKDHLERRECGLEH